MKILKDHISILLLILFELAVGIVLLAAPETFTRAVIILFGIVLLALGITSLIRYLREKKAGFYEPVALLTAIVTLTIGTICTFCSGGIISLLMAIAIVYGVIFVISGVYKLCHFFEIRKAGISVSMLSVLSGVLAVILGIVIIIYPKDALLSVWELAGILMILEALLDLLSIVRIYRIVKETGKQP